MSSFTAQITLRAANPDDTPAVRRLAALDSAAVPASPWLLAEADGRLRAALSLTTGAAIADPFYRSAGLVSLLRAHPATDAGPARRTAVSLTPLRRRPRPTPAHC